MASLYRDNTNEKSPRYVLIRLASVDEVAAENERRQTQLVEGKTLVVQECYAPGGYYQGVLTTKPQLIRGQHELEEV